MLSASRNACIATQHCEFYNAVNTQKIFGDLGEGWRRIKALERRGGRCAAWLAPVAQYPTLLFLPVTLFLGGAFVLNLFAFGNAEQQFGAAFIIEVYF
jgi:hypothetical protein